MDNKNETYLFLKRQKLITLKQNKLILFCLFSTCTRIVTDTNLVIYHETAL